MWITGPSSLIRAVTFDIKSSLIVLNPLLLPASPPALGLIGHDAKKFVLIERSLCSSCFGLGIELWAFLRGPNPDRITHGAWYGNGGHIEEISYAAAPISD